jgi:uncharacterized protein (TIGR03437 family)
MQKWFQSAGSLVLLASLNAYPQTGPTLVDTSYSYSTTAVAPGQVVRLRATGLRTVLPVSSETLTRLVQASSVPLPKTLAGIGVTIQQYVQRYHGDPLQPLKPLKASMLSVAQSNGCARDTPVPDCIFTSITVQMPFELVYNVIGNPFYSSEIVISENGIDSQPFRVGVVPDIIHVITDGKRGLVTHADGTEVSAISPAIPGETVVIYAWGLGYTRPAVQTGDFTPTPAPAVAANLNVGFGFSENASAFSYPPTSTTAQAWLTPGQVGLYQVNVELPRSFPAVPPCSNNIVASNLTIFLRGPWSFDGAAICVQPAP